MSDNGTGQALDRNTSGKVIHADIPPPLSLFSFIWDLPLLFWGLLHLLALGTLSHRPPCEVDAISISKPKLQVPMSRPWCVECNPVRMPSLCLVFCVCDCVRQSELPAPAGISSVLPRSVGKRAPTGAASEQGGALPPTPTQLTRDSCFQFRALLIRTSSPQEETWLPDLFNLNADGLVFKIGIFGFF